MVIFQSLCDTILMPANVRSGLSVLVKQPGRFEHDVGSEQLFQAIQQAWMSTQVPGPAKEEVNSIEARNIAANRLTGLFNLGAVVCDFSLGQDREGMDKPQSLIIGKMLLRKDWTIGFGHAL